MNVGPVVAKIGPRVMTNLWESRKAPVVKEAHYLVNCPREKKKYN